LRSTDTIRLRAVGEVQYRVGNWCLNFILNIDLQ
jgi:hypothetical protein